MASIFLRVPLGQQSGRIPLHRVRGLVRWVERKWPKVTCELKQFNDGRRVPWAGVFFQIPECEGEEFERYLTMDQRVVAYFLGNGVHFRYTFFGGGLSSVEEALQWTGPWSNEAVPPGD